MFIENILKEQGQRIELLTIMVEEMGYQIASIYKELDMVDGDDNVVPSTYDFCECDKHYGHVCQDVQRV
jgi:hypothetical protein